VTGIATQMADISASAAQQSTSIAAINKSTTELERDTQRNAAMFEESAANVQSMRDETQSLAQSISHFKTAPGHQPILNHRQRGVAA